MTKLRAAKRSKADQRRIASYSINHETFEVTPFTADGKPLAAINMLALFDEYHGQATSER